MSYRPATFQFPAAKGFFNLEPTRKAFPGRAPVNLRGPIRLCISILVGAVGTNSASSAIAQISFVCRARIGLTSHDTVFVKRPLRRIIVWSTIAIVLAGSDLAKAGPFRDFFTALRSAFAQSNEKPRRHRTSHKHNETPPSDASNKHSPGTSAPAPQDQRNVRMAKAASGRSEERRVGKEC